jgi:17beta-estradiol 17-dehydrogenase / very-long-chain 3-oxoacyl-CoA reductase
MCCDRLWYLGLGLVLYWGVQIGIFLYTYFFPADGSLSKYGAKTGAWALVTGASDGVGKGYVEQLAKLGFNVFLVSRTEAKLKEIVQELSAKYPSQKFEFLAQDVANPSVPVSALVDQISSAVENRQLTLLVNNVGLNTAVPTDFADISVESIEEQIRVNVTFTTLLTHRLIPHLKKNKKSGIIILSSVTWTFPSAPMLSVYAATKAYDAVLARALHTELKNTGIDVIAVSPGYVVSSMSQFKRTSFTVTSPMQTAIDTFSKLGQFGEITPSFPHALIRAAISLVPSGIATKQIHSGLRASRAKMLQRNENQSQRKNN